MPLDDMTGRWGSLADDIWTDAEIGMLGFLWSEGLSASQIAERIPGRTRNAVIGKAHRLGLPRRPSPIKRRRRKLKPVGEILPNQKILRLSVAVSEAFGIDRSEVMGRCRARPIIQARLALYWLARKAGRTTTQIAYHMERDHSTVISGARKCEATMEADPAYRVRVHAIEAAA